METSIFIAKLLAVMYLVVGLGMIFRRSFYRKVFENMVGNPGILYFAGLTALIVGFLIVMYHNIWELSWVVIITIIGWLAIVKGFFILVFPEPMVDFSRFLILKEKVLLLAGLAALAFGAVFGYFGFLT